MCGDLFYLSSSLVSVCSNGRNVVGLTIVQVLHPDERNNFWMRNFRRSRVFGRKWRRPSFQRACSLKLVDHVVRDTSVKSRISKASALKDVRIGGDDLCFVAGDRLKTRVRVLKKMLELGDEGKLGGTWKLGERCEM